MQIDIANGEAEPTHIDEIDALRAYVAYVEDNMERIEGGAGRPSGSLSSPGARRSRHTQPSPRTDSPRE